MGPHAPVVLTNTRNRVHDHFQIKFAVGKSQSQEPNADYHKNESPVAARQAEVARDYLKRAARIDELNGHPPGSDGPMLTALKKHNGGRVLVFVMGAFAEMSEDVSRIFTWNPVPRYRDPTT